MNEFGGYHRQYPEPSLMSSALFLLVRCVGCDVRLIFSRSDRDDKITSFDREEWSPCSCV